MQALSVWPSKGVFWAVPQLDYNLGSSSIPSRRRGRRKLWNPEDPVCQYRSLAFLWVSSSSRSDRVGVCCWSPKFDFGCGLLSGYSKLKILLLCERKRGSFGASFALAWALEQQAIGNEFVKEDSNSIHSLAGNTETVDIDCLKVDGARDGDENDNEEEKEAEKNGEVIEEKSRNVDVRALAHGLEFATTADDVEEVLKDKVELPLQVYSTMIRGFGTDKRLDAAMALVEWLKRKKETNGSKGPNLFVYNSLLGAVKQSEKFALVEKVMNDMAREGILPNVVTYNTLMSIYLEQGRSVEALNILEEIQKNGLCPSPVSYSTALLVYRRMEDGHGALKFFIELREKYLKGEIGKDADEDWENEFVKLKNFTIRICYQVMRRWLVKEGNQSPILLKLLADMDNAGLQPGRAEYERLVWACTREEHYVVAKELYTRIRERHTEISLSVCNHIIWLMGKAKKWWAALEIYEDLLDKGPKPNNLSYELVVSHFNILLTAARKKGIWRWGVRLLNKMEDKGLKPGSREWNAVLVACSKAAETSAAVEIFRRMVEQGEKPTIISYGALLSALEKGKLYDEASRVWEHMVKMGVEPNLYAYTIMASICVGQGKLQRVDSILREMETLGIDATVVTYNAIISGCARNGLSSAAFEWFHRMKVGKIQPNEITYEMLIEALAKDGKPRLAFELYSRAQNEGLNLSTKAYDAVVLSSQVHSATIDVSLLGPRPPEKKKKLLARKTLSAFCNLADVPRRAKPFDRKEIYSQQTEGNQ